MAARQPRAPAQERRRAHAGEELRTGHSAGRESLIGLDIQVVVPVVNIVWLLAMIWLLWFEEVTII